jgi:hypothetical protein
MRGEKAPRRKESKSNQQFKRGKAAACSESLKKADSKVEAKLSDAAINRTTTAATLS